MPVGMCFFCWLVSSVPYSVEVAAEVVTECWALFICWGVAVWRRECFVVSGQKRDKEQDKSQRAKEPKDVDLVLLLVLLRPRGEVRY